MARVHVATEEVCCLQCGSVYRKPVGADTARANPGCPLCEYVGWVPAERRLRSTALWRLPSAPTGRMRPVAG